MPTVPGALANNFIGHGVLNSDTDQFDVRSVITSAAEKKKLKLSNKKQEFAPTSCTNSPAMLGAMIWDPCYACDINPFTACFS